MFPWTLSCPLWLPLAVLWLGCSAHGHLNHTTTTTNTSTLTAHHCHNQTGICSAVELNDDNSNNIENNHPEYSHDSFILLKESIPLSTTTESTHLSNNNRRIKNLNKKQNTNLDEQQNTNLDEETPDLIDYVNQRIIRFLENKLDSLGVINTTNHQSEENNAVGRSGGFLAGFGLGFLAFGLKKLLLPVIIGAQIVKSVLIAMFLPSLLGGLGKLVGKGVSTFASASGSSGGFSGGGGGGGGGGIDDFEFKDSGYENSQDSEASNSAAENKYSFAYPDIYGHIQQQQQQQQPIGTLPASALYSSAASANALTNAAVAPSYQSYTSSMASGPNAKVAYVTSDQNSLGSYYTRHRPQKTAAKQKDAFKVFHNIPQSSLLLTDYDPFYSPLLSRLDAVFKQLSYDSEDCRERLVCSMYRNPAQFAPYSNLVSAQLSRELNELRKPSTDNPEILRFFRYMRAAKDGQEGADCFALHPKCPASKNLSADENGLTHGDGSSSSAAAAAAASPPPMLKTYQDINKLVQARQLKTR